MYVFVLKNTLNQIPASSDDLNLRKAEEEGIFVPIFLYNCLKIDVIE